MSNKYDFYIIVLTKIVKILCVFHHISGNSNQSGFQTTTTNIYQIL